MPSVTAAQQRSDVVVEIGGLPIRLHSNDPAFHPPDSRTLCWICEFLERRQLQF